MQFECWCQKQPRTKTASLCLGSTMSGLPGRSRRCNLNRKPRRCRALRTISSDFAGADLMRATSALCLGSTSLNRVFAPLPPNALNSPSLLWLHSAPEHLALRRQSHAPVVWRHNLANLRDLTRQLAAKLVALRKALQQHCLVHLKFACPDANAGRAACRAVLIGLLRTDRIRNEP